MSQILIRETKDYESLVPMFIKNDLEFSEEDEVPTDLLKCWEAVDTLEQGKLCGGCVLAKREGEYIIDGIAVEPEYRKHKLGKKLLDHAISEVKALGGKTLFLVARAPGFFKTQGFEIIKRQDAPNFFECFTCPQYNVSCFPEVMRLEI